MDQDIQLVNSIVDAESKFQVSARGLWEYLELQKKFSDWFAYQCGAANLVEGRDYIALFPNSGEKLRTNISSGVTVKSQNELRPTNGAKIGRPQKDYLLTRRAAYEIGMLNQGDKGKQIRSTFMDAKEERDSLKVGTSRDSIDALKLSREALQVHLEIYALLKVPEYVAQQEAVKETVKITGVDLSQALQLSPAKEHIKEEEKFLEPTELARHFGLKSAQQMNAVLQAAGLQNKTDSGWVPTEQAGAAVYEHGWKKGTKTGYNLKWKMSVVKEMLKSLK